MVERQLPRRLLQNPEFRFTIPTEPDGKTVRRKGWTTTWALPAQHEWIKKNMNDGKNVGAVTGYGGLLAIDCDSEEAETKLREQLPATYEHRSGGRGLAHFFFIVDEPRGGSIKNPETGEKVGDIRGRGGFIVTPPSINPKTGTAWTIANDLPIAHTSSEEIDAAIEKAGFVRRGGASKRKKPEETKQEYVQRRAQYLFSNNQFGELKPSDLLRKAGIKISGDRIDCPFDKHSKPSFVIYDSLGGAKCYSCDRGFNVLTLYRALKEKGML